MTRPLLSRSALTLAILLGLAGQGMAQDAKAKYGLTGLHMTAAENAAYAQFLKTSCASVTAQADNKPGDAGNYTKFARIALMNLDLAFYVEATRSQRGDAKPLVDIMSNKDWLGLPDKAVTYCRALQSKTAEAALTAVYQDARTTAGLK